MQEFLKLYQVEQIKKRYPSGTRIMLDAMENEHNMPIGMKGTVKSVDDAGQIRMLWDNGRTLSLIPEHDCFHILQHEQELEYHDDDITAVFRELECLDNIFEEKDNTDIER